MKIRRILLSIAVVLCVAGVTARAADTYQLAIKGEKGKVMKFTADAGGTLNFVLDGLIPNSKISGENLAAKLSIDTYFDTLDAKEDGTTFLVKLMVKNITLGNLLQLPDLGGIGKGKSPEMKLDLSPEGAISNVEVRNLGMPGAAGGGGGLGGLIPGLDSMGMNLTSLDSILPMITGLIPPIFPKDPVAIGDTWVQKASDDSTAMPIFPKLVVKYKLVSVENDKAHIEMTMDGDYNADFLNNFLAMIPEMPMGTDTMAIKKVDLKMDWKLAGTMDFLIGPGVIEKMDMGGKVNINGGAKIMLTHADKTTTPWEPKLNGTLDLTGGLNYGGTIARADYETIFPAPEPEITEDAVPAAPAKAAKKPAAKKPTAKKPAAKKK
jgi:hypothetical protein